MKIMITVHTCADGYMDFGFGLKHLEVALNISEQGDRIGRTGKNS